MKIFATLVICCICATTVGQGTDMGNQSNLTYAYVSSEDATYSYNTYHKKLYGPVKKYKDNKLVEEGWAVDNKPHSTWKQYNENGAKTAEISYAKGKRHGAWKVWDDNGVLRYSYQYHKGKPTGNWKMYDEEGTVVQERHHY